MPPISGMTTTFEPSRESNSVNQEIWANVPNGPVMSPSVFWRQARRCDGPSPAMPYVVAVLRVALSGANPPLQRLFANLRDALPPPPMLTECLPKTDKVFVESKLTFVI